MIIFRFDVLMEKKLIELALKTLTITPLQLIEKHFDQLYPGGGRNRMLRLAAYDIDQRASDRTQGTNETFFCHVGFYDTKRSSTSQMFLLLCNILGF